MSYQDVYENKLGEYVSAIANAVDYIYRVQNQIDSVKLVIFDLDNTLWRGLIAEHYAPELGSHPHPDGWPIGIWDTIQQLRSRGILCAICSKNDDDIVQKRWDSAINPPFISLEDFVIRKINWKSKVENVREIIESCSLTEKNVVFVDDNPVERSEVSIAFPKIRCIGRDPFVIRRILLWSSETQVMNLTDESMKRQDLIEAKISLSSDKERMTRDDFLRSLGIEVKIRVLSQSSPEFARCFELVNKTNQFNTTGKRWTSAEFVEFISQGTIYFFQSKDKLIEHGIVGVFFVRAGEIVQFVMSCRVIGFDIEMAVLGKLSESIADTTSIRAKIFETDVNMPCRSLYANCGFKLADDGYYYLDATNIVPIPDYVNIMESFL